jgi:hypothetical protein
MALKIVMKIVYENRFFTGRRTHLLYFTYPYCILSSVFKLATSLLVLHLRTFISVSTLILYVTSARFCLYLLIFITLPTHCYRDTHIQMHTHTSTHVAHNMDGDNQAQDPGWEGRRKGVLSETKALHTHKKGKKMSAHQS